MTKKPPSEKRTAANRANAVKSTGPRTPEGKAASAQNARKHGFTASKFIAVKLEDLNSLANLRDDAVAAYQPQNSQELFAAERIALAQHALLRCAALEAGLFTDAMNQIIAFEDGTPKTIVSDALHDGIDATTSQNRSLCAAKGFERIAQQSDAWRLFLRYQAQTERLYRRAIEEFERLKALREEIPNEPNVASEIEAPVLLKKRPRRPVDQEFDPQLPYDPDSLSEPPHPGPLNASTP
jgi:hypothetical protein